MWCECNINVYDCISTYMNVMYMNVMYTNITNDFAMLKICKWLGWSLMSWSGAPILILNEARNSPKECAEASKTNWSMNEWKIEEATRSKTSSQLMWLNQGHHQNTTSVQQEGSYYLNRQGLVRSFLQPTDVQLLPLPMAKNPTSWFVTSPCFCCWNFVGCYPRVVWV